MGVKTTYLPPQFLATIASFESKVIRGMFSSLDT